MPSRLNFQNDYLWRESHFWKRLLKHRFWQHLQESLVTDLLRERLILAAGSADAVGERFFRSCRKKLAFGNIHKNREAR